MKILGLLLLFAGVSLAAFLDEEPKLGVLEGPRLKGYQPSSIYKYHYVACLTSGFPETEQQYAGLKITCDVEFHFDKNYTAFLKIRNPKLFEVNGTSEDCSLESLKISPISEELAPLLEEPVKFLYEDGKVKGIYCNSDEPEYVLNIKRGILAVINHNFTKTKEEGFEPRMYKNWEYGSLGLCENMYDVRYSTLPGTSKIGLMKVSKTLNLKNCTEKPFVSTIANTGIRCLNTECGVIDEPLKISISTSCELFGNESDFVVRMCTTLSKHLFTPTRLKGNAATMVKQTLKFRSVESGSQNYPIDGEHLHKLKMTSDNEDNIPLTDGQKTDYVTEVIRLIKFLQTLVDQKEWKGHHFVVLVEKLQKADKVALVDIWDQCFSDDQLRFWLLEALRYVYNEDVFNLITNKIKTRELNTNQAVSVLLGFTLSNNPSEAMCREISDLCTHSIVQGNETLKKTCYLTEGALMHEFCRKNGGDCFEDKARELRNKMRIADYREKIFLVKLIGNFGHRSLYRTLLDIIENTTNTLELRVTAVYALRRIAPRIPHKVLPVLLQIFRQIDSDAELRMACFVVICDSRPGPAVFNAILMQLRRERTNQVRSFVVSHIKGMASSRYPCDEMRAKMARFALRMLRMHRMDFLTSKWLHWGQFSELLQLGGSVDLQMMSTPSSFLPRAITSKIKVQVLGRSMNLFEAGVRGEGIQEVLQRFRTMRQQSTEKKETVLRKIMPKTTYEKELWEINKQLPTRQYEEEKTKGSFYLKVMGKELMFDFFTNEDIDRRLHNMETEFTELLRKDKVIKLTKAFFPVDLKFVQPSIVGIPLKLTLQSVVLLHANSSIKADLKDWFFMRPTQVAVTGKSRFSVLHSTWGKVKFCLPQLETGTKMNLDINITSGLGGSLTYNIKEHSFTTELDLPQEKQQIFSAEKQDYTFLMYTQPVKEETDWRSRYRSTPLDGLEVGEVAADETFTDLVETFLFPTLMGPPHRHARYENWTLRTTEGKYLTVNEQNELTLNTTPIVFRVTFIDDNRQFVKLFVPGKGYVKVKPFSKGCLETDEGGLYPTLFKITHLMGPRRIRLETVVFIHPERSDLNPTEWTQTTAPLNTDRVLRFKSLIENMHDEKGLGEKWRYVTDLPLEDITPKDRFHPRFMKLMFITPVRGKVCLRPDRGDDTVITVRRQRPHVSEVCHGEKLLGMDVCLSGESTRSLPGTHDFLFIGPKTFRISVKPGMNPARKIQIKFEKGDRFDKAMMTWKASMNLPGTNPEKKLESQITFAAKDMRMNISVDMHNMLPRLRRVCIVGHVINDANVTFELDFGMNCDEYQVKTHFTIEEPSRRLLNITASYKLPYRVTQLFYKLFRAITGQFRDSLSDYKILRSVRSQVQLVMKFKTEQLVDLEMIMPSRTLTMDDVKIETAGFIPRGSPSMSFMPFSPVCTVDYDTFKTFDGVEFQYSTPLDCPHILAKDCAGDSFMVLLSKESENPNSKVVEIFVEKKKIRVEYLKEGRYQIQVNGKVVKSSHQVIPVESVATIMQLPETEELRILCENGLRVVIVRGIKIDVRVSPFLFNRACGMCGDLNAEQYQDLKTPRGLPYTSESKRKYGHMWFIPEPKETTCTKGCQLRKQFHNITKTINGESFDCYTTTPVLRCLTDCRATKTQNTIFQMTCVRSESKEAVKISTAIKKGTLDLTGSPVFFGHGITEHLACDCDVCSQGSS